MVKVNIMVNILYRELNYYRCPDKIATNLHNDIGPIYIMIDGRQQADESTECN